MEGVLYFYLLDSKLILCNKRSSNLRLILDLPWWATKRSESEQASCNSKSRCVPERDTKVDLSQLTAGEQLGSIPGKDLGGLPSLEPLIPRAARVTVIRAVTGAQLGPSSGQCSVSFACELGL